MVVVVVVLIVVVVVMTMVVVAVIAAAVVVVVVLVVMGIDAVVSQETLDLMMRRACEFDGCVEVGDEDIEIMMAVEMFAELVSMVVALMVMLAGRWRWWWFL